ncbi:Nucleolin 2 [Platanthera guangdongensis]|uniref:Nucleolin 2 n=1 Tax=Platanthera guangdongensis TaxID=2320717 RepID=A0ABR2N5A8_9ASPA
MESSSDEDEDDSEESSDEEPPKALPNKTTKQPTQASSDDSSEEDSSDESEDEQPVKKPAKKDTDVKMKDVSIDQSAKKFDKKGEKTPGNQSAASGSKTLFVGNLSYDITDDDIFEFFKEAAEVADVRLSRNEEGEFKGYGHVEFATAEEAQKAMNTLNGHEFAGRQVRLDFARERGEKGEKGDRGSYTPNSGSFQKGGQKGPAHTIFVKGFDTSVEMNQLQSSLEEFFGSCGEITRMSLPRDYETGVSKGIGYIDFKDSSAFSKALELSGSELGGYSLTVGEAKPRDPGFSGGRGGGRDGGWSGGRSGGRGRDGGRGGGGRRGGRDGGGWRGRGGDRGRGGRGGGGRFGGGATSQGKKTTFGDD